MNLPTDWTYKTLEDLIEGLEAGISVNSKDNPALENAKGVLKTSSVTYGIFNPNENKTIIDEDLDRANISPKADTIIMSRMNTPIMVGASAYVEKAYDNLYLPDRLWLLTSKENKTCMRWLSYHLGSPRIRSRLSGMATGTSGTMKNLTKESVLSLEVPTPPLPEQKKIAEILATWDRAIEICEKRISLYDQLLTELIDALMLNKRKWTGIEWEDSGATIGELIKFTGGAQPPRSTFINQKRPGYIRLLQIRDYKSDNFLTFIPEDRCSRWCEQEDVMIGRYGPPIFQILRGKSGSYNVALIKAEPAVDSISKLYIYFFLRNRPLFQLIESLSRRSAGQSGIDMTALRAFPMPRPTKKSELKISTILEQITKAKESGKLSLLKLIIQKQGLMHKLLTGNVRVKA